METVRKALATTSLRSLPSSDALERALVEEVRKAVPQADLVEVSEVAASLIRAQAGSLIVGLSRSRQEVVRRVLAQGVRRGWTDAVVRRRLAQVIGLDPRSAAAVDRYRAGLLASGATPKRAEREAKAYAKRLLNQRLTVVADHETRTALAAAQRVVWEQMQRDGDLSPYAVRITVVHKDERLCPTCRPQNGRRRSLNRDLGEGPPFHPRCRCHEEVRDEGVAKREDDPVTNLSKAITPGGRVGDASSLNRSPKKNWVENAGGLPKYFRMVAHALIRAGRPRSVAIRMAIGIVRNWATGQGNVSPKVRAAAVKAMAEWEAKKAKTKVSKADETTWNMDDYSEMMKQLDLDMNGPFL